MKECKHGSSIGGDLDPPCFLCRVEELEAENAALIKMLSDQDYDYNRKTNDLIKRHTDNLLSAQHRIKELREALATIQSGFHESHQINAVINPALANPDNTDELDALVRDAERYRKALESISKNTCCGDCQEAKRVAIYAIKETPED